MRNVKDTLFSFLKWGGVILGLLIIAAVGAYISLKLSIIGTEVAVPDITGTSVERSYGILADKGLFLEVEGEKNEDRISAGSIISQDPPPDAKIRRGRKVKVIVSLGARKLRTPDLSGETERSARIKVNEENLVIGSVSYVTSDIAEGRIIAQSPLPGSDKLKGGGVNLLISRGRQRKVYVMPDVMDKDFEDIESLLKAAGLRVEKNLMERTIGAKRGIVVSQSPLSGYPISEGEIVSITVAD